MQIWHDRCKIFNSYWYLKKKKKKKNWRCKNGHWETSGNRSSRVESSEKEKENLRGLRREALFFFKKKKKKKKKKRFRRS